jgi:hypothetical protein
VLSASVLLVALLACVALPVRAGDKKHHVLVADYSKNGVEYTVDGRVPTEKEGLLLALSRARSADAGSPSAIVVLVHERAKLSDVSNLIGTIVKADYASYRVFTFDSSKRVMTEIRYGGAIPFSTNGTLKE